MWPRLLLDISWRDLAFLARQEFSLKSESDRSHRCLTAWHERVLGESYSTADSEYVACSSVRSGFDLLLQSLSLEPGSEVAFSAVTIGDMPKIARAHQLTPVPIDLHRNSCHPNFESFASSISKDTRVVVLAHLFGTTADLTPFAEFARSRNILVVEDAAQSFGGPACNRGVADVSMFSFGPIKTSTALGGALLRVGDSGLRRAMKERLESYPVASRSVQLCRLFRYSLMKLCSSRFAFRAIAGVASLLKMDLDDVLVFAARSYRGDDLMQKIRMRASGSVLATMGRRFEAGVSHVARRAALGRKLTQLFDQDATIDSDDVFWVFPVLCDSGADAEELQRDLRAAGYDASLKSRLAVVESPMHAEPANAKELLDRTMYLPMYGELSEAAIREMAAICLGRVRLLGRSRESSLATVSS